MCRLAGLVPIVGIHNILGGNSTLIGVLLIASGFSMFAINGIIAPKLVLNADPIAASVYYTGFATLILWVIASIFENPFQTKLTEVTITTEIVMGVFSFTSGFVVYYRLLNRAGPFFSSMTFYLIPIVGVLGGVLMFGEKVILIQMAGIFIVFLGVYLINRVKVKKGSSSNFL